MSETKTNSNALCLDTNIVSYLMKENELGERYRDIIEKDYKNHHWAISFITVGELYKGAYSDGWSDQRKAELVLELEKYYIIIHSDIRIWKQWGIIRAARRKQPIAENDAWIAATAVVYGIPLVTDDKGIGIVKLKGLEVISDSASTHG